MENGDPKTNTFNSEGKILQIQYAIENVNKAGTIVGITCLDGIVLFGINKGIKQKNRQKIYKLDDSIYCSVCGLVSDAQQIINYGRIKAQEYFEYYDKKITPGVLGRRVGRLFQKFTQSGGLRPFGISLLFCGIKNNDLCLYSTDPSGTTNQWIAKSFGEFSESINANLKEEFGAALYNSEETISKLFAIIKKNVEITDKNLETFELLKLGRDDVKFYNMGEMKTYLAA